MIDEVMSRRLAANRQLARALIMEGRIIGNQQVLDKPGTLIDKNTDIRVKQKLDYVSRGALKLKSAFAKFDLCVSGFQAIDVGASTGGFTDFLLSQSANKVVAIDVGYGQLSWKLMKDNRVTVLDRTNIRNLSSEDLPYLADITVVDVSFISLKLIFQKLLEITKTGGLLLMLLKPQFEIQKGLVPDGGVITDYRLHIKAISDFMESIKNTDIHLKGITFSSIKGAKGNIEYWIYVEKSAKGKEINLNYDKMVEDVVRESHCYFNKNG
ncbi:MAG: TlyA family RNA methyltransferase [Actinomycetia bacterium]|nr:TlyA family RNA methyltransferase [Actinomycetes bacterium]